MAKKNYPAAHSMDTSWFAVDIEGNIGYFDTGESGAVPSEAYTDVDGFWKLLRVLPKDEDGISQFFMSEYSLNLLLDLQPIKDLVDKYIVAGKGIPSFFFHDLVLEFKNMQWRKKITLDGVVVKLHRKREIYYFGKTEPAEVLEILQQGQLKGVIFNFTDDEIISTVTQCFFYDEKSQYSHGRGISDYQRVISPDNPMKVQSLPIEIQDMFRLTLPIRFADEEIIQPLEYTKAHALEYYYVNHKGEKIEYDYDRDSGDE